MNPASTSIVDMLKATLKVWLARRHLRSRLRQEFTPFELEEIERDLGQASRERRAEARGRECHLERDR